MIRYNFLLILFIPLIASAQEVDSFAIKYEEQYAQNILLDEIDGVYIPVDVQDAMIELDRLSEESSRQKMREGQEQIVAERLSRGLGKWMIVNWHFDEGSRLSHHLKSLGVSHPDDMALFLVVSYYRYLNKKDQEFELRAAILKELREKKYHESIKQRILPAPIVKG